MFSGEKTIRREIDAGGSGRQVKGKGKGAYSSS